MCDESGRDQERRHLEALLLSAQSTAMTHAAVMVALAAVILSLLDDPNNVGIVGGLLLILAGTCLGLAIRTVRDVVRARAANPRLSQPILQRRLDEREL